METLDYPRLWTTLMRMGLKESFNVVRKEFFMNIARTGKRIYNGEDLEDIIKESKVFSLKSDLADDVRLAIKPTDKFKHYYYSTNDDKFMIEYFANVTSPFTKEFIDKVSNNKETDYDIDGCCISNVAKIDSPEESDEDKYMTVHLIVISDDTKIEPEEYPQVIKHELTHACIYDMKKDIKEGYYKSYKLSTSWTDDDINKFYEDVDYVDEVLNSDDPKCHEFVEFICEFLMYESDGSIKVKNPTIESKIPRKNVKENSKPKVTYRTVTPFDRFAETIDIMGGEYKNRYSPILKSLMEVYKDYDAFLETIRM